MGELAAEKHIQHILTVEKVCFINILFFPHDLSVSWVVEMILLSFMSKIFIFKKILTTQRKDDFVSVVMEHL